MSSGATVTWAHHAIRGKAKKHTIISLLFTIILAVLFTLLQGYEYLNASFNINDSIFGSCFYMTTGFHGFHVSIGVIFLFIFARKVFKGDFDNGKRGFFTTMKSDYVAIEILGLYWHFVDLVWVFIFAFFYLW